MSSFQRLVIKLGSVKQVELADYSIADTTRRYFYSSTREDTLNGIETSVDSKDDLEKATGISVATQKRRIKQLEAKNK